MTLVPEICDAENVFGGRLGIVAKAKAEANGKEATASAIYQLGKEFREAVRKYRKLPRKKEYLMQFIATAQTATAAVENLLKIVPRDEKELIQQLRDWDQKLHQELEYLNALMGYTSEHGAAKVRRIFNMHYREKDGVYLAGLRNPDLGGRYRGKVHERIDPKHRYGGLIQSVFRNWFESQIEQGQDPASNVAEFLLQYNFYGGAEFEYTLGSSPSSMKVQHLAIRDGRLLAYYATKTDGKTVRFKPGDPMMDGLTLKRAPYTSDAMKGYARNGLDFVQGDVYILDKNGKLYSCGINQIHSTITGGGRVQSAGIIVAQDGIVQAIDNTSGHYAPSWKHLLQVVELLDKEKVFDPEAIVGLCVGGGWEMFFSVGDYIKLGKAGFPYLETKRVVDSYRHKYDGNMPVPESKRKYIPELLRKHWVKAYKFLPRSFQDKRLPRAEMDEHNKIPTGDRFKSQWAEFFLRLYDMDANVKDRERRPRDEILI